jgi:O-Antigen ligase
MRGFFLPKAYIGTVALWVAALSIWGYPFQVAVSFFGHLPSSPFNAACRAVYLGFALLFLVYTLFWRKSTPFSIGLLFFILFWVVYGTRIIYDVEVKELLLQKGTVSEWKKLKLYQFAFGSCFVSSIGIAVGYQFLTIERVSRFLVRFAGCLNFAVLATVFAWTKGDLTTLLKSRVALGDDNTASILNPIVIGLCGEIGLVFAVISLTYRKQFNNSIFFLAPMVGVSLLNLAFGASRGPFLAAILMIIFVLFTTIKVNFFKLGFWLRMITVSLVFLVVGVKYLKLSSLVDDLALFGRLNEFSERQSGNEEESRDVSFADAWASFVENPVVGRSYLNKDYDYPHNIILEVLMSTGVIGFAFFAAMCIAAFQKFGRIYADIADNPTHYVFLTSYIGIFLAFLTSGCLFLGPEFWNATLFILLVPHVVKQKSDLTHQNALATT